MHNSVMAWVAQQVRTYDLDYQSVLEIGSQDVNGSVRDLFNTASYIGIDFQEGRGVDIVMDAHNLRFPDRSFDIIVATELLEHDTAFWLSLAEMGRVLVPNGRLLLTTRGNGFPEHSYPTDLWRFMPDSVPVLLELADCELVEWTEDNEAPGVFVHGTKVLLDTTAET